MPDPPESPRAPSKEESPRLPLREKFVWRWHPHFWLTLVGVVLVIWLLTKLVR